MILTGPEIIQNIEAGNIAIDPYDPKFINPASVDLRLGPQVLRYLADVLDSRKSHHYEVREMPESGYTLYPGNLYLMSTLEVLRTDSFVTVIDGKSSIGRLGISIHQTAGYGDPGYWGQYTLEVSAMMPVIIYPGMKFCQARFHDVTGNLSNYQNQGHYVNQHGPVIGPKPSVSHRPETEAISLMNWLSHFKPDENGTVAGALLRIFKQFPSMLREEGHDDMVKHNVSTERRVARTNYCPMCGIGNGGLHRPECTEE